MIQTNYTAEVKHARLLELPAEAESLHLRPGAKVQVQLSYESGEESDAKTRDAELSALPQDDWMQVFNSGAVDSGASLSDEQTRQEAIYDN